VDPGRLEQALLNLCINARDAMPEGGKLTLTVEALHLAPGDTLLPAEAAAGDYTCITVEDCGTGMSQEVLPRIFDPFFTTKEAGKGTGLGLAMVREIVHQHEGFVRVESTLGKGSSFRVFIPACRADLPAGPPDEVPEMVRGAGTVLVVDDEPMIRRIVEDALEKLGYFVVSAENGIEACDIYERFTAKIDCVLVDLEMPKISGLETCRRVQMTRPDARIVLMTGCGTEAVARQAAQFGITHLLGKPFTLHGLSRIVREAMTAQPQMAA
jgi:two-component system, cell cycle sensor histidine kinase and response regulator CckA